MDNNDLALYGNFYRCKGVRHSITMGTLDGYLPIDEIVCRDEVATDQGLPCTCVDDNIPAIDSVDCSLMVYTFLLLIFDDHRSGAAEQSSLRAMVEEVPLRVAIEELDV